MDELTLEKFEEASEIVKQVTLETKLVYSEYFSAQTGNRVYFKPENMQYTGAYKVRGAYYKISTLSEEEKSRGLITASAGNHAQGVAYAARLAGVKATVVMPTTTPLIKVTVPKATEPMWFWKEMYLTKPALTHTNWQRSTDTPLYILLMIWTLQQDKVLLPWRLSKSFLQLIISWFLSEAAACAQEYLPLPRC